MSRSIPPNFYDNAIFSAGDLDINGDAYTVSGNVRYAGDFDVEHPGNITDGTTTQDNTITPLARLDFEQLYTISQAQGNVYDAGRLKEVQKDNDQFPASFWYSAPTDPNDPTTGVPNVVYITTDLQVNGNIGQIGGIFVVVGDVITDPDDTQDTTLNGNGTIDGLVYTRGEFRINGGATGLNVNGGIWAGEEARLNGSADVTYNADYMTAMQALDISGSVQISSWREGQNPYYLN
jgi:cytoskeletal protein CcmA (bactofilin family)